MNRGKIVKKTYRLIWNELFGREMATSAVGGDRPKGAWVRCRCPAAGRQRGAGPGEDR
jgi:hypothetical protein